MTITYKAPRWLAELHLHEVEFTPSANAEAAAIITEIKCLWFDEFARRHGTDQLALMTEAREAIAYVTLLLHLTNDQA